MKFVLFGANGGTGRLLSRMLLDGGHEVAAVTRRPRQFPFTEPRLTIVTADVRDAGDVRAAVDGADGVVSTLSVPFTAKPVEVFSAGVANIVDAMHATGGRRLIVTSSAGAQHYPDRRNNPWYMKLFEPVMANTFGKTVYQDTRRMEAVTRESGLDWTIVRPSLLFDLPAPTDYIAGNVAPVGLFTARIDLAHYLATLAIDGGRQGETLIISTTEQAPSFLRAMLTQTYKSPAA